MTYTILFIWGGAAVALAVADAVIKWFDKELARIAGCRRGGSPDVVVGAIAGGFVAWAILVALICAFFYGASERRSAP